MIRESNIPRLLKDKVQKVLIAGKYLNVIRGCVEELNENESDDWLELPVPRELRLDFHSGLTSINTAIDEACSLSSRALLKLLQERHGLSFHLRSLRRFFLLEHGDFFIQFMDTAEDELRVEVKDITVSRIQNLLQLAIQTSTLAHDVHREDISCSLASHNLIQHLHLIQVNKSS